MEAPEEIREVYQRYWNGIDHVLKNKQPWEGAFGFGGGLRTDPCHERFAQELEATLEALSATATRDRAREILRYIYGMPREYRDTPAVYWMLMAVHIFTLPLIELLDAGDAAALRKEYADTYPPRDRLLPQEKVLSALKKQSVGCNTPQE